MKDLDELRELCIEISNNLRDVAASPDCDEQIVRRLMKHLANDLINAADGTE